MARVTSDAGRRPDGCHWHPPPRGAAPGSVLPARGPTELLLGGAGSSGARWGRRGCPRRARAAPAREAPESEED